MATGKTPLVVSGALERLGADLSTWRKLRRLTVAEIADRAGLGVSTVLRLENGHGASLANALRVARALGVLELMAGSVDPYLTEVGQLRADESLPRRVRSRAAT